MQTYPQCDLHGTVSSQLLPKTIWWIASWELWFSEAIYKSCVQGKTFSSHMSHNTGCEHSAWTIRDMGFCREADIITI